jgi:uncharacterized FlaG/YvyC family protein
MQSTLGESYRSAQKESEKQKNATKDPQKKKQLGRWESELSETVAKMSEQIDQEYEAAVKQVHFKISCSGK